MLLVELSDGAPPVAGSLLGAGVAVGAAVGAGVGDGVGVGTATVMVPSLDVQVRSPPSMSAQVLTVTERS
jgi:hypothetical protein